MGKYIGSDADCKSNLCIAGEHDRAYFRWNWWENLIRAQLSTVKTQVVEDTLQRAAKAIGGIYWKPNEIAI